MQVSFTYVSKTMKSVSIFVLMFWTTFANAAYKHQKKIIDLTHPFDQTTLGYPNLRPFQLNVTHKGYTEEGYWLQIEDYGGCIHVGTHLDAPCHIGRGKWTLDQIPLSRFIAPAAVVDITHRTRWDRDANLEIEDLLNWEWMVRRSLDGTIVLVNTGWGKKWSNRAEFLGTDSNDVSKLHFPDKIVDLSYPYDSSTIGWIQDREFELFVTRNGTTDQGVWLQTEEYISGTHVGTHIDAPCHMSRGGWTLEDIPLNRFVGPAAVVDISDRARTDCGALLQIRDLLTWEMWTGKSLNNTIIMVRTGWGRRWPDREAYLGNADRDINNLCFPGVSGEAAMWLVNNRRIFGLGIDTLSLDSGPVLSTEVPAHVALLGANVYGIENVANLDRLPISGATLHVAPMRIRSACGAPTRITAFLPRQQKK